MHNDNSNGYRILSYPERKFPTWGLILITALITASITTVALSTRPGPESESKPIRVTVVQKNSSTGNNVIMTGENAVYYQGK